MTVNNRLTNEEVNILPAYEYSGVPAALYSRLLTEISNRIYFDANVNHAGYWFRQVG
jgi:hypothetical protein